MKHTIILIILLVGIIGCQTTPSENNHNDHVGENTEKSKSPRTAVMANIGKNHVHIDYSSPSVRNRQVWGGLVSYDEVWVMGAHKATSINFSQDVKINNTHVKKGKYALFAIPNENHWTIIINEDWDQHLSDNYDIAKDLIRVDVIPSKMDQPSESLTFEVIEMAPGKGRVFMKWEYLEVNFDIENIN